MADESMVSKDNRFKLVCTAPDVCLTPGKTGYPVPYPIMHFMDQSKNCSPNVFLEGKPVFLHNESYVDNVTGDEPGKGGGVVSQVNVKISHSITHSKSVFVNGQATVRTGDTVWMNWKKI